MIKLKSLLVLLLLFCLLVVSCVTHSQQASLGETHPDMVITAKAKEDLVMAVLSEAKTPNRYDLYLGNSIDIALPPETTSNVRFMNWIQALFAKEAGWSHIEDQYTTQLKEKFSEAELRELLNLVKQPLVKRLVQAEIEAYSASAKERRRLLSKLWDNYNRGMFKPPSETLQ